MRAHIDAYAPEAEATLLRCGIQTSPTLPDPRLTPVKCTGRKDVLEAIAKYTYGMDTEILSSTGL